MNEDSKMTLLINDEPRVLRLIKHELTFRRYVDNCEASLVKPCFEMVR